MLNQERLKKELAAQKARAAAIKHLDASGSGPSRQETLRNQTMATAASSNVPTQIQMGDNTLHAIAQRRAKELQYKDEIMKQSAQFKSGEYLHMIHGKSKFLLELELELELEIWIVGTFTLFAL